MSFFGAVQIPKGPDSYPPPTVNGIRYQKPQGKGLQAKIPEHCYPVFIKFMARLLKKYATPYFEKLLVVGNKTLQGKRDMCIHHILKESMNPNCDFYHAQTNEFYSQYVENICTVLALGMDYIRRHGAADIQVLSPVGSNCKRENLQQVRGGTE